MRLIAIVLFFVISVPAMAYELVVFGGSPAGVAAAIAAADKGVDVVIISQTGTVGGAISNGLGAGDFGSTTAITGFQKTFFDAVKAHYSDASQRDVEPSVAEAIFIGLLNSAGVDIVLNAELLSATVSGRSITSIQTSAGTFSADHFVDASYPADLAAMAGVPFRLGREDRFYYDEPYARDVEFDLVSTIQPADVAGADAAFADNPYIISLPSMPSYTLGPTAGMPTMTFRLSVSKAANRVAFAPTANYELYAPSWRRFFSGFFKTHGGGSSVSGNGTITNALFSIAKVRGDIYDLNNGSAHILNVPIPMEYFTGNAATRQAVLDEFEDYSRNLLHFAQTDASIPSAIRAATAQFGLNPAEFTDHGNWPPEAYIREGRRIVGRDMVTARTIYDPEQRERADAVAIGTYHIDIKPGFIVYADGKIMRDVSPFIKVPFYEIPLGAMLPMGIDNLLVPVGISASPTAYGSLRMEPQAYMMLGEAAGVTAYIAKLKNTTIAGAAKDWYTSIKYTLTQPKPNGRGAVVNIRTLGAMIPQAYRAGVGLDPVTCAPIPFIPAS